MGKGATIEDALDLPLVRYNELLMHRTAYLAALPGLMEHQKIKAERRAEEDKMRREAMED